MAHDRLPDEKHAEKDPRLTALHVRFVEFVEGTALLCQAIGRSEQQDDTVTSRVQGLGSRMAGLMSAMKAYDEGLAEELDEAWRKPPRTGAARQEGLERKKRRLSAEKGKP